MDIGKAVEILETLGNGIDPTTGEAFPAKSLYNCPDIIRALLCCTNFIKNPPAKTRKTPAEKRAENVARGLPENAGMPWTDDLRSKLADNFKTGLEPGQLAEKFARTRGSIIAQLKKQGLISDEEARTF